MFFSNGMEPLHLQGAFVSMQEVERIAAFIGGQRGYPDEYTLERYLERLVAKREGALAVEPEPAPVQESVALAKKPPLAEKAPFYLVRDHRGNKQQHRISQQSFKSFRMKNKSKVR